MLLLHHFIPIEIYNIKICTRNIFIYFIYLFTARQRVTLFGQLFNARLTKYFTYVTQFSGNLSKNDFSKMTCSLLLPSFAFKYIQSRKCPKNVVNKYIVTMDLPLL